MEGAFVETPTGGVVTIDGMAVVGDQMLGGGNKKTGGAAGRVADHVPGGGRGHLHHQLDDVARGAELPVLSGAGDLTEHILVKIALGVGIGHLNTVELIDDVGQYPGAGIMKMASFMCWV